MARVALATSRTLRSLDLNRQTECKNQEVEQYLRLYTSHVQDDWSTLLSMAEFVMNARCSSASDHTPFKLIYGYTPDFMIPPG